MGKRFLEDKRSGTRNETIRNCRRRKNSKAHTNLEGSTNFKKTKNHMAHGRAASKQAPSMERPTASFPKLPLATSRKNACIRDDQVPGFLDYPAYMSSALRWMMEKAGEYPAPGERVEALLEEALQGGQVLRLYQPLEDHREAVIIGEPKLEMGEVEWKEESEGEVDAEVMKRFKRMSFNYKNQHSKIIEDDIPAFWLTEFKNTRTVVDMFQPHDEPVLAHLTNVDIVYKTNLMCYVIEFHFLPYFRYRSCVTICTLCVAPSTKMIRSTLRARRFSSAPAARSSESRPKTRTNSGGHPHPVERLVLQPAQVQEDEKNVEDETQMLLTSDFEIGHFLRARIIPD
ncbi:nucleosome assembly protein [Culex quinquefasciatus]|uniref:Nucleosome assembly protein n=1 Tax=Culex quinquefasciatus TaxID=7176 RepID=B0W948_CULQU|nr:nucleosome assembly protein [Culex quinquefasciatus]|eukprot:XP_001845232.1 nucleosome assembly protein [Culex quinquefasciatus]